jgi:hypothetical protein
MPMKDSKLNYGPMHLNNNILVAIDIRVGATQPLMGDLLEVCFMPLNHSYRPHPEFTPFNLTMKPNFPVDLKVAGLNKPRFDEQYVVGGLDSIKVAELALDWWRRIRAKPDKRLVPVVWDWPSKKPWLEYWLDGEYLEIFADTHRDIMSVMHFLNDRDDYHGTDIRYKVGGFTNLVKGSGLDLIDRNSLMSNCKAISDVYRYMLHQR